MLAQHELAGGVTAGTCTRLGGVCAGLSGMDSPPDFCGVAARRVTPGWRASWDCSMRLTPVTSSLLLKGASTTAKRAARAGSVSASIHLDSVCLLRSATSLLCSCCGVPAQPTVHLAMIRRYSCILSLDASQHVWHWNLLWQAADVTNVREASTTRDFQRIKQRASTRKVLSLSSRRQLCIQ